MGGDVADYVIQTYSDAWLEEWARFWNANFSDRPNFFPVTPALLRRRIIDRKTDHEIFYPGNLQLATRGDRLLGFCHFGARPPAVARQCYPGWSGGTQGYIGFLYVAPAERRKGIGAALYQKAYLSLFGCTEVVVDGQCFNAFYGNSEYPFTPFWGTPEGVSVPEADDATIAFFKQRGHSPRYTAVMYEARLPLDGAASGSPDVQCARQARAELGMMVPQLTPANHPDAEYASWVTQDRGLVTGYLVAYKLREVAHDLAAVYELRVDENYQRRGFAKALLSECARALHLGGVRRLQALTVPALSPEGPAFYEKRGFRAVHRWMIF